MHLLIFSLAFYFLPAIVAMVRHSHNATGILLLNLFVGWTVVGWFVALMLAISSTPYYPYAGACYHRREW